MDINKANIANALHSVAKEHIVTTADEIYDNDREQYQSEINFDLGHIVDSPEFVKVVLDSEGKILYGVKQDGDFIFGCGVPSQIQEKLDEIYDTYGKYEDNPEYVRVYLDKEGKILWGIQKDGNIYYGAGVPNQVKSYIDEKISELSLDEYEAIVNFIDGLEDGTKSLLDLLNEKVDKEEGKSLISSDFASTQSSLDTSEYLQVTTDSDSKVLQGIKSDGTSYIGGDLKVNGDATVRGNVELTNGSIQSVDSPEYLKVTTDVQGKILDGIKKDGSHYIHNVQSESINSIKEEVADKVSKEEGKGLSTNDYTNADKEIVAVHEIVENSQEYIDVKVDSENKVLEGITIDGIKKINIPVDNGAAIIETTNNSEFLEAKVDAKGELIEGINKNGEKIFGVIPPQIKQYIDEHASSGGTGVQSIEYDDATGDMYATYDDESGVTDVSMDPNGDIYVEYETGE